MNITPSMGEFIKEERNRSKKQQLMSMEQSHNPLIMEQQPPPVQVDDNPFAADKYNSVNVPDQPLNYGGGMVDSLLNDMEVPEEIRRKYWHIFHKDNVLTFLDEKRHDSKMLNFDIMKIDWLNSIPYYDYTFEKELEFNVLRNVFETKLDRALGIKGGNVKNERIMLQSQFSENRHINDDGNRKDLKEGFFKRLLGRR